MFHPYDYTIGNISHICHSKTKRATLGRHSQTDIYRKKLCFCEGLNLEVFDGQDFIAAFLSWRKEP